MMGGWLQNNLEVKKNIEGENILDATNNLEAKNNQEVENILESIKTILEVYKSRNSNY